MNPRLLISTLAALVVLTLTGGCGGARPRSSEDTPVNAVVPASPAEGIAPSGSGVDISYVAGHSIHRFLAESNPEGIEARTFVDRQILRQGTLDRARYGQWLNQVYRFVNTAAPQQSEQTNCRAPFTVKVWIGQDSRTANGCRSTAPGAKLSRLTRDGELLLRNSALKK